jgi:hypothetical protein
MSAGRERFESRRSGLYWREPEDKVAAPVEEGSARRAVSLAGSTAKLKTSAWRTYKQAACLARDGIIEIGVIAVSRGPLLTYLPVL